jgi:hypothetical protein
MQVGQVLALAANGQMEPAWVGSLPSGPAPTFLIAGNNLSDLTNVSAAWGNLGLGSAAGHAASDFISSSLIGAANGVATLGADSKIPAAQLPSIAISDFLGSVNSQAAMLALTGQRGDWAIRTDTTANGVTQPSTWLLIGDDPTQLSNWKELPTPVDAVLSVNGHTGVVVLTTSDIAEGSNLYFTNARARAAVSGTTNQVNYDSATGIFSLPQNIHAAATPTFAGMTLTGPLNKVTITAPATAATLTLANNKTFTVSNTLTLAGTDGKTLTLTGSLTVGADTSITGGGTVALAGFTLTVPASGTAALASGIAGGQTINGGTAAGESLTLQSTAHATKGKIFFGASSAYDGANVRLGVGTASPATVLESVGTSLAQLRLSYTAGSVYTSFQTDASGNLTVTPTGSLFNLPTSVRLQSSNYASQTTGIGLDMGLGSGDFRYLYADELHAKSFLADLEQALAGGQIISKSVAEIASNFTVPAAGAAATLTVKDLPSAAGMAVFVSGDTVRLRQFSRSGGSLTIADAWGVVTGYVNNGDGTQSWTFTRSTGARAGSAATGSTVSARTLALDYGTSGNGYYEVNAIDGAYGANSPYAQVVTWTTHPQDGKTLRTRMGNLNGITGVTEYGLYAGDGAVAATNKYVRITDQNFEIHNIGLDLYEGSTKTVSLNPAGPYLAIGNPLPTSFLQPSTTGIWMGNAGSSTYKMRVGATNSSGNLTAGWSWDNTNLNIVTGGGAVAIGANGIAITPGSGTQNIISWVGRLYTGEVYSLDGGAGNFVETRISAFCQSSDNAAQVELRAFGNTSLQSGNASGFFTLVGTNSGTARAYASFFGGNFTGLEVGPHAQGEARAMLDVYGAGIFTGNLTVGYGGSGSLTVNGSGIFSGGLTVDTTTLRVDATNHRVGIGTTSPTQLVSVSASSNPCISVNNPGISYSSNQLSAFGANAFEASILSLANNTTGGVWLKSFNNAAASGIGGYFTSYSENDLTTWASFTFNAAKHNGSGALTSHGSTARLFVVQNNGTDALVILGSRSIRLPGYGAGTATFDASGNVTASSDETLKDIKGKFADGLAALRQIEPITFRWKRRTGWDTQNDYHGFSAQNVARVLPGAVGKNPDGSLTLQERPLLAATINAVKELDAGASAAAARIAALEAQVQTLTVRVAALEAAGRK